MPTKTATEKVVIDFIEERIIIRFRTPLKITTDNAKAFNSEKVNDLCLNMALSYPTHLIITHRAMDMLSPPIKI